MQRGRQLAILFLSIARDHARHCCGTENGAVMICCLVANSAWNISNFRAGLIQTLREQGHDVHIVAPPGAELAMLAAQGCQVHEVNMDCRGTHPVRDGRLLLTLWQTYRRIRPDIVLHYTIKPVIYGSLAAHLLGIPALNTITGLGTAFLRHGWLNRMVKRLYKLALASAPIVIFQNADDRSLFVQAGLLRAEHAMLVPGSGVDITRFSPQPLPDQAGDAPVFLLVGRMLRDKGVVEFVEAAAHVRQACPKARFALLGFVGVENVSAISAAQMDAWVAAGAVEYWGAASDVQPMLAQADCIVLPSYREGMPRTLLEGGAMGRPLVATDVPGCREVVKDGETGFLCEVKRVDALAEAMLKVAGLSPHQRAELGHAARQHVVSQFAEKYVIDSYIKFIYSITRNVRE